MKQLTKWSYMLLTCLMTLSICSCSNDDDGPADPSQQEIGKWKITEYEDLAIRVGNSTPSGEYWTFWVKEWDKEVAKRRVTITKSTPLVDGWYIVSDDSEWGNVYRNDLERVKPITVEGRTMKAEYFLKQYNSTSGSDDEAVIFRATVTFKK